MIARGNAALLALVAALVIVLPSCTQAGGVNHAARGHALSDASTQASGTYALQDSKIGQTYGLSFPMFDNVSKTPITVTSVQLGTVPKGFTLVSYRELTATAASGYPLGLRTDVYTVVPQPDPYSGPITVAPGETSLHFYQAMLRFDHPNSDHIQGCIVYYEQSGHPYTQTLTCDFQLLP